MTSIKVDVGLQKQNFEQLEGAARYYDWMLRVMTPYMGYDVLDVGCGQGNIEGCVEQTSAWHRHRSKLHSNCKGQNS